MPAKLQARLLERLLERLSERWHASDSQVAAAIALLDLAAEKEAGEKLCYLSRTAVCLNVEQASERLSHTARTAAAAEHRTLGIAFLLC